METIENTMKNKIAGNVVLSETQKQAADINCDGQINVNDMTQIQIVISSGVGL